jgi:hypothetical protein
MKSYELSPAALRALNDMREDYVFEDGPAVLDEVLDVLRQLTDLTHEERQLRTELESMRPLARASVTRAFRAARSRKAADGK